MYQLKQDKLLSALKMAKEAVSLGMEFSISGRCRVPGKPVSPQSLLEGAQSYRYFDLGLVILFSVFQSSEM
jgi:hypothetical protein